MQVMLEATSDKSVQEQLHIILKEHQVRLAVTERAPPSKRDARRAHVVKCFALDDARVR